MIRPRFNPEAYASKVMRMRDLWREAKANVGYPARTPQRSEALREFTDLIDVACFDDLSFTNARDLARYMGAKPADWNTLPMYRPAVYSPAQLHRRAAIEALASAASWFFDMRMGSPEWQKRRLAQRAHENARTVHEQRHAEKRELEITLAADKARRGYHAHYVLEAHASKRGHLYVNLAA